MTRTIAVTITLDVDDSATDEEIQVAVANAAVQLDDGFATSNLSAEWQTVTGEVDQVGARPKHAVIDGITYYSPPF